MSNIRLKSLLNKRKEAAGLMDRLASDLDLIFGVQDTQGRWVWGEPMEDGSGKFPIIHGADTIGWVYGEAKAASIADLIAHLAKKESDKKQMGYEVLDLYREINLIYNFSEKLANALNAEMIAQTALEEVRQLIEASGGAVILLSEKEAPPSIVATLGTPFFTTEDLLEEGLLREFLLSGQANIRNAFRAPLGREQASVHSLLYAPLKVKHRLLGLIILASMEAIEIEPPTSNCSRPSPCNPPLP